MNAFDESRLTDISNAQDEYVRYMGEVKSFVAAHVPAGTIFNVSNIANGPDGPGTVVVSIQGEYVEGLKALLPYIMVTPLTAYEYAMAKDHRVIREQAQKIHDQIINRLPHILFVVEGSITADGRIVIKVQGEYVAQLSEFLQSAHILPLTEHEYRIYTDKKAPATNFENAA